MINGGYRYFINNVTNVKSISDYLLLFVLSWNKLSETWNNCISEKENKGRTGHIFLYNENVAHEDTGPWTGRKFSSVLRIPFNLHKTLSASSPHSAFFHHFFPRVEAIIPSVILSCHLLPSAGREREGGRNGDSWLDKEGMGSGNWCSIFRGCGGKPGPAGSTEDGDGATTAELYAHCWKLHRAERNGGQGWRICDVLNCEIGISILIKVSESIFARKTDLRQCEMPTTVSWKPLNASSDHYCAHHGGEQ